ncbi:hypothetical protein FBZ93_11551 [Bradyrhizobium macuxiense]|uniref:Integrase n=1 Tax=Bradyrhizobium macuxiense TaxID=1755647 RepID=A0A560L3I2_9BRAD|nr:hypothetical protein FBZ93_11551 [Bradyrhizobium macuxiense]
MPTFTKLKSGSWRVQVRRKSEYVANTFVRRRDAEEWAIDVERSIDRGSSILRTRSKKPLQMLDFFPQSLLVTSQATVESHECVASWH